MTDIRLNVNIAKAIARILQMDEADLPMLKAVHGALADILLAAPNADEAPADEEMRRAMRLRLDAEGGFDALVDFGARSGVVDVRGVVANEGDRRRVLAIAHATHGVRSVHDHLVWVDRATQSFMPSVEDSCPG